VVQSPIPNAYVTNVKNPILVIHSELIRLLNREELFFVIGHELGHIKSSHVLAQEIVSTALYALDKVPLLNRLAPLSLLLWSKEAEISADRVGLLLVQDEIVCSRALIKLLVGLTENEGGKINVKEFLRQKAEVEADAFALRRIPVLLAEATSTHPFVGTRVMKLAEFKNSEQFTKLLRSDKTAKIEIRLH
jgi:Zn-dependent protease with chaperone function